MFVSDFVTRSNLTLCLELLVGLGLLYVVGTAVYNRYFHPYRDFPGPFLASLSGVWYFWQIRHGLAGHNHLNLHEKYGTMVRISPNHVQISDPAAIDTIYGPGNVFPKAEFYSGFDPKIGPRAGSFDERDEKIHSIRRRLVAPLYTQGSILEFEPCVDRLIALFYRQMEMFTESGYEFDMSTWLRKYTFDVIGEIFYGRKGGFGFMRDQIDYNNWCLLLEVMTPLASAITYITKPLRGLVFAAEMIYPSTRTGAAGFFEVIKQSHAAVRERVAERSAEKHKDKKDLLNRLLDMVNEDPDPKVHWTELDVTVEIWTMIWAGSDTTATALTSIFYHLHKNPLTLAKLRNESDEAFANGQITYPLRYFDCSKLPYLHAVVREAMRTHSSLGLGLPRVVPPGGEQICGKYFPEGQVVLMNACVVQFDKSIFGEDADHFIPERWIRCSEKQLREMERHMLQFGYGPRICIGRHITNIEMYKLLPLVLRDFEFEGLEDREWKVFGGWFHQQRDVFVKVRRRREKDGNATVEIPEGGWKGE